MPLEPLGFQRVLDLVIEPAAGEPPLDHGHRERPAAGADHGLERRRLALGDDLAGEDLAVRIFLLEQAGKLFGLVVQVGLAARVGQDQQVIRPDAVRRPSANSSATSLGASTGVQPSGKSRANLYSRWTQRLEA